MKTKTSIDWGVKQLKYSSTPRLDAEVLLAYATKKDKTDLYQNLNKDVLPLQLKKYRLLINQRAKSIPIAHLTGYKEFYNLTFHVNSHTLIPRPETEAMVEKAIAIAKTKNIKKIYDIGTGSGNIAIALAKNLPNIKIIASDICKCALQVAKRNVLNHDLEEQIELIHSNLSEHIKTTKLIVANLPYVPEHYEVSKDILFEPKKALFAGVDGLDLYKKMFGEKLFNKFNGIVLIELGANQYKPMSKCLEQQFANIKITPIDDIDTTICGLMVDFS